MPDQEETQISEDEFLEALRKASRPVDPDKDADANEADDDDEVE